MMKLETAPSTHDPEFYQQLDRRYRGPLMSFFTKRVGDRAEAEDLTQEVFLRMMRQPLLSAVQKPDSYIFAAAANILRDRARQLRTRGRSLALQAVYSQVEADLGEDFTPSRVLTSRDTLQQTLDALAELSQRTRDIFVLFRLEHLRQREIAAHFGISVSAVEKHIVKALAHLASRVEL